MEGDASSASYFLAGATITGGTITVEGCGSDSLQVWCGVALWCCGVVLRRCAPSLEALLTHIQLHVCTRTHTHCCALFACMRFSQGDVRFAEVMGLMGAKVEWAPYSITVTGESD